MNNPAKTVRGLDAPKAPSKAKTVTSTFVPRREDTGRLPHIDDVVSAVEDYYFNECPPPKRVVVDNRSVRISKTSRNMCSAQVVIETDYVQNKRHKTYIKFKLGDKGQIVPSTLDFILT